MNDRKYKVLMVHNYYQIPGGEDTVVANEKKLLEDNGHEVVLYTRDNKAIATMTVWQRICLPFSSIFSMQTYREIQKIILEQNIDIVHVHNTMHLISPSVYYAAFAMKTPVVQTVHNFRLLCPNATFYRDGHICEDCTQHGLREALKHRCYRGSFAQTLLSVISLKLHRILGAYGKLHYICLSEFNRIRLLTMRQIKLEQIFIKPNFTYQRIIPKDTNEYYLYVGRLEEIKGTKILIAAFSRMPDRHVLIAGTSEKMDYYVRMARNAPNIQFVGQQSQEELDRLFAKAKCVIVPSQCYESFGMVVIEAFASKTPVVVGSIGNIGALVTDGFNGLRFQYNSSDALIDAIRRFDTADTSSWGDNAYQTYVDKYSPEINYVKLCEIYETVINSKYEESIQH